MPVGVKLTGADTEYVSTPDAASLDIAGDLSMLIHVAMDDWTPANIQTFLDKIIGATGYLLRMMTTGKLQCIIGNAGNDVYESSIATGFVDGADHWVGCTFDNTAKTVKFWTSTDGSTWSQLGATIGSVGTKSPGNSNAELNIGRNQSTSYTPLAGTVYYAAVYSGIGANTAPGQGTLVAEWSAPHTGTRYLDSTGKVWTLNGSAYSTVITA